MEWETSEKVVKARHFVIDLDLPRRERWREVGRHFRAELHGLMNKIHSDLDRFAPKPFRILGETLASAVASALARIGVVYYDEELIGLAEAADLPLGQLTLMQFVYEASACCTSIVLDAEIATEGETEIIPVHIRTMDWEMDALSSLTVDLDFVKRGDDGVVRSIYGACSWAGYVGVLTGMRCNCFSVSVNFRKSRTKSGEDHEIAGFNSTAVGTVSNACKAIQYSWPIGFLVRVLLETVSNFEEAVESLARSELIAPVYFIVCGTRPGQGVILTRQREGEFIDRVLISRNTADIVEFRGTQSEEKESSRDFVERLHGLVQTNIDFDDFHTSRNVLLSTERRQRVYEWFSSHDLSHRSEDSLWSLISSYPIYNSCTISGTYMVPKLNYFHTRLPVVLSRLGFQQRDTIAVDQLPGELTCAVCHSSYLDSCNNEGCCTHTGEWHDSYSQCSAKCVQIGVQNIGKCHWSCCHRTKHDSICPKSDVHTPS